MADVREVREKRTPLVIEKRTLSQTTIEEELNVLWNSTELRFLKRPLIRPTAPGQGGWTGGESHQRRSGSVRDFADP